jgi:YVTN family beta-propeller protein
MSRRLRLLVTSGLATGAVVIVSAIAGIPAAAMVPLDTIAVGDRPSEIAVSPDGTFALVSNTGADTVSRIDLATRAVTATIPVPEEPNGIAFVPDGSKAYVASWVSNAVTVIDTATNTTSAVSSVPAGTGPYKIAMTPDGTEAIVSGYGSSGLVITISTATDAVVATGDSSGSWLQGIAVDPTGTTAYVGSIGGGFFVYDLATDTFDPDVITGLGWLGEVEVTPDGSEVWMTANDATGAVRIYDVVGEEISFNYTGFIYPNGIAFNPDGSIVYVSEYGIDAVSAIDFTTLDVLYEYGTGVEPYGVAASPDGRFLYTVDNAVDTMSVIGAIQRISGPDRYEVAVSISKRAFPGTSDSVFIASGQNYPDALSAGPVAAQLNGPLLLTVPTALPASVIDEIERLDPSQIYIVGGPNSVSAGVLSQLDGLLPGDAPVIRAGGADRYEASRNISELAYPASSATVPVVYLTTGRNFPDALSAGAAGAANNIPVVLVDGQASTVGAGVLALLADWGTTQVKIAGGPVSVSPAIELELQTLLGGANVERLSGADRYEASLGINQDAFTSAETAYLAVGTKFPDALAGAALSAADHAPLFVVPGSCVPQAMLDAMDAMGVGEVVLLGGPASLTPDVFSLVSC